MKTCGLSMQKSTSKTHEDMILCEIWRFPVKGFAGERLDQIECLADSLLPHDREYAVTTGHPATHEKLPEGWLPKRHFLQLLKEARLAGLEFRFDMHRQKLSLYNNGQEIASAPDNDRASLSEMLYQLMPDAFTHTPILCRLDAGGYSDTPAPWISLGGTASLDAFAKLTRTDVAASRFRLNLIIETDTPFIEQSWAGQIVKIGDVECEVIEPVGRCGAISVNPKTHYHERDYLPEMERAWGHTDLGMFARICNQGVLKTGAIVNLKK